MNDQRYFNDGTSRIPLRSSYKTKESSRSPISNYWSLVAMNKGEVFSARTGHTVVAYQKIGCTKKELRSRYAFLSCQMYEDSRTGRFAVPFLPPELCRIIFSFIEIPQMNSLFIFGGTNNRHRLQDLHQFDLATEEWKSDTNPTISRNRFLHDEEIEGLPCRRSGGKGVIKDHSFVLFGGYNGRGGSFFNDLWKYEIHEKTWEEIKGTGTIPLPRTDHTVVQSENKLIVFGGFDGRKRFNDVIIYNFDTNEWNSPIVYGEIPSKRFGHSSVLYGDSMYCFGGWDGNNTMSTLHRFRIGHNHWSDVEIIGPPPPHRYRHTAVVLQNKMLVFGGVDSEHRRYNDVQCFNFDTNMWSKLGLIGSIPTRSFHSAVIVNQELFIVGGYDGTQRMNDIHKCRIKAHEPEPEGSNENTA